MFLLIFSPIKKSVLNLWSRIIIVRWSSFDLHSWFKNGKCRTTMEQRRKPLDLIWLRDHATNTKMQMFLSLTRDTGGHMRKHLKGIALLFLSLSPCVHAIIFHSQPRPFPYDRRPYARQSKTPSYICLLWRNLWGDMLQLSQTTWHIYAYVFIVCIFVMLLTEPFIY